MTICRREAFLKEAAVARCSHGAFSGCLPWQDYALMRSRALDDGKMHARCALRHPAVAIFSRDAFPSVRRWRDCALMRSWPDWQWQYTCAVRSRVSIRGKIPPRCVPGRQSVASFALHASRKWPRTGKLPVRGKIRAPCIRNELALAGYARHVSEKPRKSPSEDASREYLARKEPFCCTDPSNHARRANLAIPGCFVWVLRVR